jgi:tetratricopeptide (TPR) repeat protein
MSQDEPAEAHLRLAQARARGGDHSGAIVAYRDALLLKPDLTDALIGLCDLYLIQSDWAAAVATADAAVAALPSDTNAHYVRGGLLGLVGRLDEAERVTREALRIDPGHAGAYANLGAIATWRQDYSTAIAEFGRALALKPDIQEATSGLAYALLASGRFEEGWRRHEQSRSLGLLSGRKQPPVLWDGRPMLGGTVTLFGEAGLGDVIQFCRLVPLARKRVGRLVLYLQEYYRPLERLLRTLEGVDEITLDPDALRTADACLSVFSLPYIFNASLAATPVPVPYLAVDRDLSARWAERLRGDALRRVGIVWGGNPRLAQARISALDRRRSVPLPLLESLFEIPVVNFYSLQKGAAARVLAGSKFGSRIVDQTALIEDFADTAALIDQLDLVITVDTSVVHLAGALGKPVWMLNRFDSCWRWGPQRGDAPWYPSLRIFRQPAFGEWGQVIARVAEELHRWGKLGTRRGASSATTDA